MKDLPVTADWLSRLSRYARAVAQEERYREYRPLIQDCYGRLDESQRNSEDGKSVLFYLALEIIEEGMMCPDVELFGLDGTRYRLSDFRGKYILLDFWSGSCGPCKASIPELEKIVQENERCLTLVSITTDGEKVGESIPISILLYGIIFAMEVVGKDLSPVSDLMEFPLLSFFRPKVKFCPSG